MYNCASHQAPAAAGAQLFAEQAALLDFSEKVSLLVPGGDHSWLRHPSVTASRRLLAKLNEGMQRSVDRVPECTHGIEVADWLWNCGKNVQDYFSMEFTAWEGYHHDTRENLQKKHPHITSGWLARQTWLGDPKMRPFCIEMNELATDSPELRGKNRFKEQIQRAWAEPTRFLAQLRYFDKRCAANRDRIGLLQGKVPFGDPKRYQNYVLARIDVVEALPVSADFKKAFVDLCVRNLSDLRDLLDSERPPRSFLKAAREEVLDKGRHWTTLPKSLPHLGHRIMACLAL